MWINLNILTSRKKIIIYFLHRIDISIHLTIFFKYFKYFIQSFNCEFLLIKYYSVCNNLIYSSYIRERNVTRLRAVDSINRNTIPWQEDCFRNMDIISIRIRVVVCLNFVSIPVAKARKKYQLRDSNFRQNKFQLKELKWVSVIL